MRMVKKMKNKNYVLKNILLSFLGVVLVALGLYIYQKTLGMDKMDKTVVVIPYIFIAIGCGILGHFTGNLIQHYSTKGNEELKIQIEIEKNDERNVLIAEKSKAKAYDLMIYLFAAMLIIFSLMGADKLQILVLVAIYLSLQIYALYWKSKFESRM